MEDVRELWARYLDGGQLDAAEEKRVLEVLEQGGAEADALVQDARLDGMLRGWHRAQEDGAEFAQMIWDRVHAERDSERFIEKVKARVETEGQRKGSGRASRRRKLVGRWNWVATAAAGVAVLLVGWFAWTALKTPSRDNRDAQVEPVVTQVELARLTEGADVQVRRNGQDLTLTTNAPLYKDDVLVVPAKSGAKLTYTGEETTLRFAAGSEVRLGQDKNAKRIELRAGECEASFAHQPTGAPAVLITPHARVTVVGTVFTLHVGHASTRVEMKSGRVDVSSDGRTVPVSAGQFVEAVPGQVLIAKAIGAPSTRDCVAWPFSAKDPWNISLGSDARYEAIKQPGYDPRGASLDTVWGMALYQAKESDPQRKVRGKSGERGATFHLPDEALAVSKKYMVVGIVEPNGRTIHELGESRLLNDGSIETDGLFTSDLRRDAFPPKGKGLRIFGGSSLGGLIRKGELAGGIPHALALAVPRRAINIVPPSGGWSVWPAAAERPTYEREFAREGNLYIGSLVAIPPNVDLATLGVGTSGPGYEVARALQDYGAYLISSYHDGDGFTIYGERSVEPETSPEVDAQIGKLLRELKIVSNNGPATPGGGGTPRRPQAPPFGDENEPLPVK